MYISAVSRRGSGTGLAAALARGTANALRGISRRAILLLAIGAGPPYAAAAAELDRSRKRDELQISHEAQVYWQDGDDEQHETTVGELLCDLAQSGAVTDET